MLYFTINDQTKITKKNIKYFKKITKKTSKLLKIKTKKYFEVSIVNHSIITNINKKYRNIDKTTDVISFAFNDNNQFQSKLIGEMFINIDQAQIQAKKYNHSFERELYFLFTHGLLHILGYDHINKKDEKVMFKLQDKILELVKVFR